MLPYNKWQAILFVYSEASPGWQRPGAAGGGGGEGGGALDFLRNQPRFETLRVLVQQSPALLNPLLQVELISLYTLQAGTLLSLA